MELEADNAGITEVLERSEWTFFACDVIRFADLSVYGIMHILLPKEADQIFLVSLPYCMIKSEVGSAPP